VRASSDNVRPRRPWLASFAAVNGIAAWAGALGLVFGGTDFGERANHRLPFDSPVVAGLALAIVVAIPLTWLAWSAWTGAERTDDAALIVGAMLIGGIAVQLVVLQAFSLFQPTYVCVGTYFISASHRVRLGPLRRGVLLVVIGAIIAAVGVGLLPHLVKDGLTVTSALSAVVLLAGIATALSGARSMLKHRRRLTKVMGGAAIVMFVALMTGLVAPAVAATNVASTKVTTTPGALGLRYRSISLTTTDGAELAAWYLPGINGAGVVMLHGAGSTRSAVLDQAAALVARGYTVVLLEARGHGDSHGTAMDFGWYGDLDIAASTEFLATRPEIDAHRIGIVGFSMGGEEAIGAAANDPRIRAVVAEGVTGRQAADKAWLSDVYGWRGWVQEQIEKVQYGITDLLTDASPPVSLRSAVANARATRFLLITAGNMDDEGHAARHLQSGARQRVTVWNVEGASHTGGYQTQPDQWQRQVVNFLDANLRESA
jgi:uncharacterized protein